MIVSLAAAFVPTLRKNIDMRLVVNDPSSISYAQKTKGSKEPIDLLRRYLSPIRVEVPTEREKLFFKNSAPLE